MDAYKSRSIWGAWWSLPGETQSRYFSSAEVRFIKRYGARLDQIASMVVEPKNEGEQHFLKVCLRNAMPKNDAERLWLRAQLVCRYEQSIERAARADLAEHENATLRHELTSMQQAVLEAESVTMEMINELKMHRDEIPRRVDICNVRWASPLFSLSASPDRPMFEFRECR